MSLLPVRRSTFDVPLLDFDFYFDNHNDFRFHPCSSVAKTHSCEVFNVPVSSSTFEFDNDFGFADFDL